MAQQGLGVRAGVHVGEVELVGTDVRGRGARGGADHGGRGRRNLVSDMTRALAGAAGLQFEDRGIHKFKGHPGEWRLAAYVQA